MKYPSPFGIDLNHNNVLPGNFADYPLCFIDHKATQGAHFVDPAFAARRTLVRSRGVKFTAYHFSTGEDAQAQANNFLAAIGPDPIKDPIKTGLDWEESPGQGQMTIEQAREWVDRVFDATGRWPDIYGSNLITESPAAEKYDRVLANCKLWLARPIKSTGGTGGLPRDFVMPTIELATWGEITILQYSADADGYCEPPFASVFDGSDWNLVDLDEVTTWP